MVFSETPPMSATRSRFNRISACTVDQRVLDAMMQLGDQQFLTVLGSAPLRDFEPQPNFAHNDFRDIAERA